MTLRPRRPLTLTARLVAVVVLLVAVTARVIGTATALAMKRHFTTGASTTRCAAR